MIKIEGKIKMPEALALSLSENADAMEYFNALSNDGKKEFISKCNGAESISEYIIARNGSVHSLCL